MKSVRTAHIVVVAACDHALIFAAQLRRMDLGELTMVATADEARGLCRRGGVDACILVLDDIAQDASACAESEAPGRGCSVPSLLIAGIATPDLRRRAREAGYTALIPAAIAPRILYRRIRAALQRKRAARPQRRRLPSGILVPPLMLALPAMAGKTTLH